MKMYIYTFLLYIFNNDTDLVGLLQVVSVDLYESKDFFIMV